MFVVAQSAFLKSVFFKNLMRAHLTCIFSVFHIIIYMRVKNFARFTGLAFSQVPNGMAVQYPWTKLSAALYIIMYIDFILQPSIYHQVCNWTDH